MNWLIPYKQILDDEAHLALMPVTFVKSLTMSSHDMYWSYTGMKRSRYLLGSWNAATAARPTPSDQDGTCSRTQADPRMSRVRSAREKPQRLRLSGRWLCRFPSPSQESNPGMWMRHRGAA